MKELVVCIWEDDAYQVTHRVVLPDDTAERLADRLGANGWSVELEPYTPPPPPWKNGWLFGGPPERKRIHEADPNPPDWSAEG